MASQLPHSRTCAGPRISRYMFFLPFFHCFEFVRQFQLYFGEISSLDPSQTQPFFQSFLTQKSCTICTKFATHDQVNLLPTISALPCSIQFTTFSEAFSFKKWCATSVEFTVYSPKTFPKAFQLRTVQFGLENVPIQRVLMGKKTPFFYAIVPNSTRGHSGREITPIDPCQRAFKRFKQTFPKAKLLPVKFGLESRPESQCPIQGSISTLFRAESRQFCFCFKEFLP